MQLTYILLQGSPNDSGLMNIIMIIALVVIFWLFMIRPQQKKQKEIRKFREGIKSGDRVITAGGIHGKVKQVKETSFVIQIADGVCITIDKGSVYPSAEEVQAATDNEKVKKQ